MQFEQHRRYLITLLTYAGAADPEHLSDTVLDRAAKRLTEGEAIDNIRAWLRGAARMVLLESQTNLRRESDAAVAGAEFVHKFGSGTEADHTFLDECLNRLTPDHRSLIESYYQPQGKSLLETRRKLSIDLGISSENLRTRALRVRKALEECLRRRRAEAGDLAGKE